MSEFTIKTNCRIEELTEEEQLIIARLVNHLASHGGDYRKSAFKSLAAGSKGYSHIRWLRGEDPWETA